MKKIVYIFASVMLTAASASAIMPKKVQVPNYVKPIPEKMSHVSNDYLKSSKQANVQKLHQVLLKDKANTEVAATAASSDVTAEYAPSQQAFYMGWTPDGRGFTSLTTALTGIRNYMQYNNFSSGASSYSWNVPYVVDFDENANEYVYENEIYNDVNLRLPLKPLDEFLGPDLTASNGTASATYEGQVDENMCGMSTYYWGWYAAERPEDVTENDIIGVTTTPSIVNGIWSAWGLPAIDRSGAEAYNSNGVSDEWANIFSDPDLGIVSSNVKINGYGAILPYKPSSYMLNNMWALFDYTVKEDVVITATFYGVDEEGYLDLNAPKAKGEALLPKGTSNPNDPLTFFEIYSIDADGNEMDEPFCVMAGEPVFVLITGVDNEDVVKFSPNMIPTILPVNISEEYMEAFAQNHLLIDLSWDDKYTATNETVEEQSFLSFPWYGTTTDGSSNVYGSDFAFFFDVEFPVVMNVTDGSADVETANFTVDFPDEGGSTNVDVLAVYPIASYLEEGYMTAESNDWITFTTEAVTEGGSTYTKVNVSVDALPADVKGRVGYIDFNGLAQDFYITVNQGEVAGISNVAAANGKVELYDLQGRKLNAVPSNGIYLERQGNQTVKRIAR